MQSKLLLTAVPGWFAAGAIALFAAPAAHAVTYGFQMTGGASGSLAFAGQYLFVEVEPNLTTLASDVQFKFTNTIPLQPNDTLSSRLPTLWIDTGSYANLFSSMSITAQSSGVNLKMATTLTGHPFIPNSVHFSTDFQIERFPGAQSETGINPGEYLVATAVLSNGKSFADVVNAMAVGIDPLTAAGGLRVAVLAQHILGTQLYDDAAFITGSVVSIPVPEPESSALMLGGLGVLGWLAKRRRSVA